MAVLWATTLIVAYKLGYNKGSTDAYEDATARMLAIRTLMEAHIKGSSSTN